MTREPVAPDCWGKYLLATFWALIDSYPLGRKLALLFEVTETICGEKARTTTAATTQAAMTFHGLLMTTRPSAANTAPPCSAYAPPRRQLVARQGSASEAWAPGTPALPP